MPDLLVQVLTTVVLLALIFGGYVLWIRPRHPDRKGTALLLLIMLTLVGGMLGSLGWWMNDPRSFSWALPPLASRMLASAGWAFGIATFLALSRPSSHRIRLVLLMLATYLTPLLIAILLFHLNRFSFSAPITYGFFAIVVLMTTATLAFLFRQPTVAAIEPTPTAPRQPVRVWLVVLAVVAAVWGLALFLTDDGPSGLVWVWPGDLLTSRLIAVMLWTIAVGAAYGSRDADIARVMLAVAAVYGAGVVASNLWSLLDNKPVRLPYLIVFGGIFAFCGALLAAEARHDRLDVPNPANREGFRC